MKIEYRANVTGDKKIELNIIRPQDFSADVVSLELVLNRLYRMQDQAKSVGQAESDMYKERQRVVNYLRSLREQIEKVLVEDYIKQASIEDSKTESEVSEPIENESHLKVVREESNQDED